VVPDGARLWPLATLQEGDPLAENPLLAGLAAQKRSTLKEQKQVLANVLNQWLDEGETGLSVAWKSEIDVRLGVSHFDWCAAFKPGSTSTAPRPLRYLP
jgi:hypothetical protein